MQKCIKPPVCSVHGLHRILSSYWVAYCYLMKKKIHQSPALFYFYPGMNPVYKNRVRDVWYIYIYSILSRPERKKDIRAAKL